MTDNRRKFLLFTVQNMLYALDLVQVAEVCDPPPVSPIPLVSACYSGAINFHGDIVAIMNLALFLGMPLVVKPEKIVVLQQEIASLAFFVDTIVRIIFEDEAVFTAPPDNNPFASATLTLPEGETLLLDLGALAHKAETDM
jgi:purine-binding chemotaxis protein CheW